MNLLYRIANSLAKTSVATAIQDGERIDYFMNLIVINETNPELRRDVMEFYYSQKNYYELCWKELEEFK